MQSDNKHASSVLQAPRFDIQSASSHTRTLSQLTTRGLVEQTLLLRDIASGNPDLCASFLSTISDYLQTMSIGCLVNEDAQFVDALERVLSDIALSTPSLSNITYKCLLSLCLGTLNGQRLISLSMGLLNSNDRIAIDVPSHFASLVSCTTKPVTLLQALHVCDTWTLSSLGTTCGSDVAISTQGPWLYVLTREELLRAGLGYDGFQRRVYDRIPLPRKHPWMVYACGVLLVRDDEGSNMTLVQPDSFTVLATIPFELRMNFKYYGDHAHLYALSPSFEILVFDLTQTGLELSSSTQLPVLDTSVLSIAHERGTTMALTSEADLCPKKTSLWRWLFSLAHRIGLGVCAKRANQFWPASHGWQMGSDRFS